MSDTAGMRLVWLAVFMLGLAACTKQAGPASSPTTPGSAATSSPTPFPNTTEGMAAAFGVATPIAVPSPQLVDGLPAGVVGPLLVYMRHLKQVVRADTPGINTVFEIVTYDVGARRPVASFTLGDEHTSYGRFVVVGHQVFLEGATGAGTLIRELRNLDGSVAMRTESNGAQPGFGEYSIVSRDGELLASSTNEGVQISELRTGRTLMRAVVPGLLTPGGAWPIAWSPERDWLVAQLVTPHSLDGLFRISMDGSVSQLAEPDQNVMWFASRDGRFAAQRESLCPRPPSPDPPGCALSIRRVVIRSIETNTEIASIELADPGNVLLNWSLDGMHLLYSVQRPAAGMSRDNLQAWIDGPVEWFVLDLQSSRSTPVAVTDLARGAVTPWRITLDCLLPNRAVHTVQPFASGAAMRTGTSCSELSWDGQIVSQGRPVEFIGTIEIPQR